MSADRVVLVSGGLRLAWANKGLEVCRLAHESCAALGKTVGQVALDPAVGPSGQVIDVRAADLGSKTWGFSFAKGLAA